MRPCVGLEPYYIYVNTLLKSGNLNLLETSESALPFLIQEGSSGLQLVAWKYIFRYYKPKADAIVQEEYSLNA